MHPFDRVAFATVRVANATQGKTFAFRQEGPPKIVVFIVLIVVGLQRNMQTQITFPKNSCRASVQTLGSSPDVEMW